MGKSRKAAQRSKHQGGLAKRLDGKYYAYALLLLVLVFFAAIRFRLRTMPLERDDGEYAYAGQLMLQGIPPYKLAYTMERAGSCYGGFPRMRSRANVGVTGLLIHATQTNQG